MAAAGRRLASLAESCFAMLLVLLSSVLCAALMVPRVFSERHTHDIRIRA
ncbi:hypothetical protein ACP4OV_026491 [Aristida adscensionis]